MEISKKLVFTGALMGLLAAAPFLVNAGNEAQAKAKLAEAESCCGSSAGCSEASMKASASLADTSSDQKEPSAIAMLAQLKADTPANVSLAKVDLANNDMSACPAMAQAEMAKAEMAKADGCCATDASLAKVAKAADACSSAEATVATMAKVESCATSATPAKLAASGESCCGSAAQSSAELAQAEVVANPQG